MTTSRRQLVRALVQGLGQEQELVAVVVVVAAAQMAPPAKVRGVGLRPLVWRCVCVCAWVGVMTAWMCWRVPRQ